MTLLQEKNVQYTIVTNAVLHLATPKPVLDTFQWKRLLHLQNGNSFFSNPVKWCLISFHKGCSNAHPPTARASHNKLVSEVFMFGYVVIVLLHLCSETKTGLTVNQKWAPSFVSYRIALVCSTVV